MGIIYRYTNPNNGKVYIGQTIHPEQRKRNHIHEALVKGSDFYFHRAIRKHGFDTFIYEVLEEADDTLLADRELHHIQQHNSVWPNGYNQRASKHDMGPEIRKKISETKKRKWIESSEEEKQAHRDRVKATSRRGHSQTETQKRRASEANRKKWIVTYRNGNQVKTDNLLEFCRVNGIKKANLYNTYMGQIQYHKDMKLSQDLT